jgi:hypothetical protein
MAATDATEARSLPSETRNGIVYLKRIALVDALANLQNCKILALRSISGDNVGSLFQLRSPRRTEDGFVRRSR